MDHTVGTHQLLQEQQGAESIGKNGSNSNAVDSHFKNDNEEQVQQNV